MDGQVFVQYDLEIVSSRSNYLVTSDFDRAFPSMGHYLVICDQNVASKARGLLPESKYWILVDANEQLKTIEACGKLLEKMAELNINKDFEIVAVGGGAVQDAVTLVASLYMRGLDWVYIPTTLMSMMDSCIGGKSSINVGKFKNTVGNFYPPRAIFIEPEFVETLSPKDISCGISEGAKICFAANIDSFVGFVGEINDWRESDSPEDLMKAIFISLEKKKWFIEIDEFDRRERKLLNFGHSFGHALEASTNFAIPHGIAVLIGMMAAINRVERTPQTDSLADFITQETLRSRVTRENYELSRKIFLEALAKDKKNSLEFQRLILPNQVGDLEVKEYPLNEYSLRKCLDATELSMTQLGFKYEIL